MIIFVDGFDKSGRTTLAKQVAHDLSFDKSGALEPIAYERYDSFWNMMANLNWIDHFGSTVVFDGSFISDDLFDISDDELAMFAAFCQKHDIYFYFCHSKDTERLEELSGMTHDQFVEHSTRLYGMFSGIRMFVPVTTHDIYIADRIIDTEVKS